MTTKLLTIYEILNTTKEEIEDIINNKSSYYTSYPIKKRSGSPRYIDAPFGKLKSLQNSILYNILYKFSSHPIAHGFVKNRSPITNARQHVGAKIIVSVDLKNFFNSITQQVVADNLKRILNKQQVIKFKNEDEEIGFLSEILTYKGRVPQGAPTSPIISNIVCHGLDKSLNQLQIKQKCIISRYADDISISSNKIMAIGEVIRTVAGTAKGFGFRLNSKKTKIKKQSRRMVVTGIVVNKKININKTTYRNLRAKLHNFIKSGHSLNINEYQKLRGQIEWIRRLHPQRGKFFLEQLSKVK